MIVGGAQENTLASAVGLHRMPEYSVRLISGPTTGPEGSLVDRAQAIPGLFQVCPSLVRQIQPWTDIRCVRDLTRLLLLEKPEIVHTHSGKAGILGRLAARRAGVPIVIHSIHGPSFGPFQGVAANGVFRTAEKIADRWTDHFITVCQAMADQYLKAGIGSPEKYTRIWSGFNLNPYLVEQPGTPSREQLRNQLGIQENDLLIGSIARLFKLKGHDEILDIASDLLKSAPNVHFLWVGDGAWRERLQQRIYSLGLQNRVHLTGLVPPETIPQWVRAMDILVHLSQREGLARALPQALACGKPVVALDCDGAREICLDNQTGFLIPPDNRRLLLERMKQLCLGSDLRTKLGDFGRDWVKERFSEEKMIQDLKEVNKKLGAGGATSNLIQLLRERFYS